MAIYKYEAKDGPNKNVKGNVEAPTEEEALNKIYELGYMPIKIFKTDKQKPCKEAFSASAPKKRKISARERVNFKDITIFTRQLSSLLKSGVPIIRAIKVIAVQSENQTMKNILEYAADDISKGVSFSESLKNHPSIFPAIYVSMVKTGENSGKLHEVLSNIAGYRKRVEEFINKVRTAMFYPLLTVAVGIATIIFMFIFVMPRIVKLLTQLGRELPAPTKFIIWLSSGIRDNWTVIIVILCLAALILKRFSKMQAFIKATNSFNIQTPIIKDFTIKLEISRFSRTMEILLKSGIALVDAVGLAAPIVQNEIIRNELVAAQRDIKEGGAFGKILQKSKLLPAFVINLINVAEESGRFDEVFGEIASMYESETDDALKTMMSLLEPLMILGIGLIVGFIVISMLLPIFEINLMAQ